MEKELYSQLVTVLEKAILTSEEKISSLSSKRRISFNQATSIQSNLIARELIARFSIDSLEREDL